MSSPASAAHPPAASDDSVRLLADSAAPAPPALPADAVRPSADSAAPAPPALPADAVRPSADAVRPSADSDAPALPALPADPTPGQKSLSGIGVSGSVPTPDYVLGVDLDGVCADYVGAFRRCVAAIKRVSEDSLTQEVSWGCREWGISSPEEFDDLHRQAVLHHDMFLRMEPLEGVVDALWRLSDAGVWIRIVTHRLYVNWGHEVTASHTVRWLDRVGVPYRDLCFVAKKAAVDADAFLEDAPHNIIDLRSAGKIVVIFDQPYNRRLSGLRARNWTEAEKHVHDLAMAKLGYFPLFLPGLSAGADRLERQKYSHGRSRRDFPPEWAAAFTPR